MNNAEEIYKKYGKLVDIVIDGGNCGLIPSTLVDCSNDEIVVLREGLGDIDLLF
jgi:tRNA A37 threonylcarbamoyladenosine synthetase subunit TsaC/SUA5/YrdC